MQFFIFVLLICLFIFLYCVYVLANDDFIFLRRDVTMEKLFNIIFLGSFVSLFFSRLFYGFWAKDIVANPLVFLLFPYFPGLSLLGGVIGAGAYIFFLSTRKNNQLPLARMSDFFSLAFLISLPIGFIGYFMFGGGNISSIEIAGQSIAYFSLFVIFLKFFLPALLNGKLKEGTISLVVLMCFSIVNLVANIFPKINFLDFIKNLENIILVLIFASSMVTLFLRRRKK